MATGATEFVDATIGNSVFIPDVWTKKMTIAREKKLNCFKCVRSDYGEDLKVGRRALIPTIGNMASRAKSENTAITYETIAETTTTLTINADKYAAFGIETIVELQESVSLREAYRSKLGYALALQVDTDIAALVAGFTQNVGTLNVDPIDDNWLRALQYLDDADALEEGRYIWVSPAAKSGLLKMDKFSRVEYIGDRPAEGMPTISGILPMRIYGADVMVSTNTTADSSGHDCAFLQSESIGAVLQMSPEFHVWFDPDYLTWKIVAEEIYGVIEVRDDHGVWVKAK